MAQNHWIDFSSKPRPQKQKKQIICESFHLWDPKQVSKASAIPLPSLFWAQLRHRWSTNKCHILDIQSMPAERHPNKETRDSSFIAFCKDVSVKWKVKLRLFIQLAQNWKRCDTHTQTKTYLKSNIQTCFAKSNFYTDCWQIETCMQKLLAFATSSRLLFRSCEGMILANGLQDGFLVS